MPEKRFSITERIKSFRYAFDGIREFLLSQHNALIHLTVAIVVVAAGLITRLSAMEWALVVFAVGLVWMAELFNTAIEKLCDLVSPGLHPKVKIIKDLAAAAVLVTAIAAVIIAFFIFIHKLSW
jgi:diacylglycerol kinase (ATP)